MSFENERRRRIQAIIEILEKAGPQGVVPQLLYRRVAPEITKERLFIYGLRQAPHESAITFSTIVGKSNIEQISTLMNSHGREL